MHIIPYLLVEKMYEVKRLKIICILRIKLSKEFLKSSALN